MGAMSPALRSIVDRAYEVFARYQPSRPLAVCRCPVCVNDETALKLTETPLRHVSRALLAEYTNSAHGAADHDLRYFLPRYFELLAQGEEPDNLEGAIALRRMREGSAASWPTEERAVVKDFFLAHFLDALAMPVADNRWEEDSSERALLLCASAGFSVTPLIEAWGKRAGDLLAVAHVAALTCAARNTLARGRLGSEFWNDCAEASQRIVDWLRSPTVHDALDAAFFAAEGKVPLQNLLSEAERVLR